LAAQSGQAEAAARMRAAMGQTHQEGNPVGSNPTPGQFQGDYGAESNNFAPNPGVAAGVPFGLGLTRAPITLPFPSLGALSELLSSLSPALTLISRFALIVGASLQLRGDEVIDDTSRPETFEVLDGVRRAKAAEVQGIPTIAAQFKPGGAVVQLPIDALLSPKATIDTTSLVGLQRFSRALREVRTGTAAPILVQEGSMGIPLRAVQLK
jgi:hypothetical protein